MCQALLRDGRRGGAADMRWRLDCTKARGGCVFEGYAAALVGDAPRFLVSSGFVWTGPAPRFLISISFPPRFPASRLLLRFPLRFPPVPSLKGRLVV